MGGKPQKVSTINASAEITKLRDEQISKMPLMNMIRNCRCMYYVPAKPPQDLRVTASHAGPGKSPFETRPELELEGFDEHRPISADITDLPGGVEASYEKDDDGDGSEYETDTDASDYDGQG